jgi:hypothetical protein
VFDCSKDVRAFHDQNIVLPRAEQTAMRRRRDANRDRLRKGLEADDRPLPIEFVKQGSYAMRTMLQHHANDYDIDDGVYFDKADLVGARDAEMTPSDAKWMVRDAVDDGSFAKPPEVRRNCVRIFYAAGYHVDMPVYRRFEDGSGFVYELASGSEWRRSDARDVTAWFDRELEATGQTYLVRRLVRYLKKHARSRDSWCGRILSGFAITALVIERRHIDTAREDRAVYETMKAVRDRLNWNLVVSHPVTPGDTITSGTQDTKAAYLRDRLTNALDALAPLFDADCTRKKALACWDKVYDTDFFSLRSSEDSRSSAAFIPAVALGTMAALESATSAAVLGSSSGRHA